jgi:hypothetical protein
MLTSKKGADHESWLQAAAHTRFSVVRDHRVLIARHPQVAIVDCIPFACALHRQSRPKSWGTTRGNTSLYYRINLVFTIRFTRKLLKYLHADAVHAEVAPTTVLGDWYANMLFTRHLRLVICVSERSLLPVFVEAKDRFTFAERLCEAVRAVMEGIGVARSISEHELHEMSQVRVGPTSSRRVLDSLNELSFLSRYSIDRRPQMDLTMLATEIAETPCSLIKYESPKSMTLALLRNRSADA